MEETSGWLWIVLAVLAVVVLAAALIYGTMMWGQRRKDYATKHAQEKVTREHYRRNE
jgi:flagellar basal body-associated protein FliL